MEAAKVPDKLESAPVRYRGLWQRAVEEEPIGTLVDDTTRVLWLQAEDLYVDIRLPKDESDSEKTKSFAGFLTTSVPQPDIDECTWHRVIDFKPPSGSLDRGNNTFSADGVTMTEIGYPGNDYLEVWNRLSNPTDGMLSLELVDKAGYAGMWVFVGSHWARAVGQPWSAGVSTVPYNATFGTVQGDNLVAEHSLMSSERGEFEPWVDAGSLKSDLACEVDGESTYVVSKEGSHVLRWRLRSVTPGYNPLGLKGWPKE